MIIMTIIKCSQASHKSWTTAAENVLEITLDNNICKSKRIKKIVINH